MRRVCAEVLDATRRTAAPNAIAHPSRWPAAKLSPEARQDLVSILNKAKLWLIVSGPNSRLLSCKTTIIAERFGLGAIAAAENSAIQQLE
jgi:hypothetical protein